MLVEKYKPKKLSEVIGQREIIVNTYDWLKKWKPGKALMIYGPTGTGKTLIAELMAKENNMNLLEINSSDDRSASFIKEVLLPASKEGTLSRKRLILIDDVDSLSERGGIAEIIKIIGGSSYPIILTATDAYDSKLRALRGYCELLRIRRIYTNLIEKTLNQIALKEKIKIDRDSLRNIALNSDGDIRSALNDLENLSTDEREREKNIFETLRIIFQGNNILEVLKVIDDCDKDEEEIFWWIEQNVCSEYKDQEKISKAFDLLSKADLFRSKIFVNQNYRFKKYMKNMLASICLIDKNQKRFISYKPPDRLIMLGATRGFRKDEEEFYRNLNLHCSMRKIKEQSPYLKIILGDKNF
jgi:replication factor C large subunit